MNRFLNYLRRATGIGYRRVPLRDDRPEVQRLNAMTAQAQSSLQSLNKELMKLERILRGADV